MAWRRFKNPLSGLHVTHFPAFPPDHLLAVNDSRIFSRMSLQAWALVKHRASRRGKRSQTASSCSCCLSGLAPEFPFLSSTPRTDIWQQSPRLYRLAGQAIGRFEFERALIAVRYNVVARERF
jgi:hypothetical protein